MDRSTENAVKGYVFCDDEEMLSAITYDKKGANLPLLRGSWKFQKEVALNAKQPFSTGVDPERVLKGLRATGYFIWPSDSAGSTGLGKNPYESME